MTVRLAKLHATGNDFLVHEGALPGDVAARLCDRHRGVGADGLVTLLPGSDGADCTMVLHNADGGRAEMSGNGMVTQGARVGDGSVLGEGVILNPGIPVIDANTGEELARGVVPPWSIVVQAGRPRTFPGGEFSMPCALVIRRLAEGERHDKAKLNDILRDHGIAT